MFVSFVCSFSASASRSGLGLGSGLFVSLLVFGLSCFQLTSCQVSRRVEQPDPVAFCPDAYAPEATEKSKPSEKGFGRQSCHQSYTLR